MIAIWADALRIRQWPKNLLVYVALVFAFRLRRPADFLLASVLFLVFCGVSSFAYLLNDICDRDRDRNHPLKRDRPVASGRLTLRAAATGGAVTIIAAASAALTALSSECVLVIATYLLLQLAYNGFLRRFAGADVIIIALGFVLRAVAGAVAIGVVFSEWLIVCTFFGAVRMALGKRQAEVKMARSGLRAGWEAVSDEELRSVGAMTGATLLIVYTLYCFDSATARQVGELEVHGVLATLPPLLLSLPFVYFGVVRYEILASRGAAGEPEYLLFRDTQSLTALLGWFAVSVAALYLWPGGTP